MRRTWMYAATSLPRVSRGRISLPAGRQGKRSRWAFFSSPLEIDLHYLLTL
jgi:hypothetical protein